jgi:hypothetical protein
MRNFWRKTYGNSELLNPRICKLVWVAFPMNSSMKLSILFSLGLLWLEKRKKVTNRIAAVLSIASSLGEREQPCK